MYFCNCRGIRERDIKAAIADGCCSYPSAYKQCSGGAAPQCGRCREDFDRLLTQHYRQAASGSAMPSGFGLPSPVAA